MGRVRELRVHGAAGTPPEATLDLAAVPLGDPTQPVAVYERPHLEGEALAFTWGGLTSGRWWHALWLLLLPFILANLAGWTLRPAGRGPVARAAVALVRVAGALVTALTAGVSFLVLVDLVGWQVLVPRGTVPAAAVVLGLGGAVILLAGVWVATRVRLRPPDAPLPFQLSAEVRGRLVSDVVDPAGDVALHVRQGELWNHPGIIERLRSLHLGLGLSVLGALAWTAGWGGTGLQPRLLAWAWAIPLLFLLAIAGLPGGRAVVPTPIRAVGRLAWPLGAAPLLAGAPALAAALPGCACPAGLPGVRGSLVVGSLAFLLVLGILAAVQLRSVSREGLPLRSTSTPPALLLLSIGSVVVAGLGVALLVVQWSGRQVQVGPLLDWLAFLNTGIVVALTAVALVAFLVARARSDRSLGSRSMQALRRMTTRPARVMVWAAAVPPSMLLVGFFTGPELEAVPWLPRGTRGVSLLLGVLAPSLLVGGRLVAAVRSREARRGVGVLFDLALFWPRWFHPFTPPTYSDRAVTALARETTRLAESGPLVVSGHSQGSVIAASALLLVGQEMGVQGRAVLSRVGLLTHGSPLGHLYAELFPGLVGPELFRTVAVGVGWGEGPVRWRNLQRATDPIAGPLHPPRPLWTGKPDLPPRHALERPTVSLDHRSWDPDVGDADPCHRFHSRYTLEPGYARAIDELAVLLAASPRPPGGELLTRRSARGGSG